MAYPLNLLFDRLSYLQRYKPYSTVLQEFLWSNFSWLTLKVTADYWGCSKFPSKETRMSSAGPHWEVWLYIQKSYIASIPQVT